MNLLCLVYGSYCVIQGEIPASVIDHNKKSHVFLFCAMRNSCSAVCSFSPGGHYRADVNPTNKPTERPNALCKPDGS